METILALPVIAAAVYFMVKGVDVRLVLFTATLVNVSPLQIVRRTGPPLFIGALAALVVVLLR